MPPKKIKSNSNEPVSIPLCATYAHTPEEAAELEKARQKRILHRRQRILVNITQRKIDAGEDLSVGSSSIDLRGQDEKPQENQDEAEEVEKKSKTASNSLEKQIEESRKQLEQLIIDGETFITNIRVAAAFREKKRRSNQKTNHKERLEKLQNEADESMEMYDEICKNWELTVQNQLPLELQNQIQAQQDACDALLEKKDDVLHALRREIQENDFEYEKNLEMYQNDITLLGDRIDGHINDLRSTFLEELQLIEESTCRNRKESLEHSHNEWKDLLEKFETMEVGCLNQRKSEGLDKFQTLNDLFSSTKEESRKVRNNLEDDLRVLTLESEKLKAACQLNLEKLDFNLYILRNQEAENIVRKNSLKRILVKLQEKFSQKACRMKIRVEKGKRESERLIKEINRMSEVLVKIGRRIVSLARNNHRKYMEIWLTNEEIARNEVHKLVESEKFIYETQLGVDFLLPNELLMDLRPKEVTDYLVKKGKSCTELKTKEEEPDEWTDDFSDMSKSFTSNSEDSSRFVNEDFFPGSSDQGSSGSISLKINPNSALEFVPGPEPDPQIQRRLMRHVAKVLCDETGFIIEKKLRRILSPMTKKDKNLIHIDAVLAALGISDAKEMEEMGYYILKKSTTNKGVMSKMPSEMSAGLTEMNVSKEGIQSSSSSSRTKESTDEEQHTGSSKGPDALEDEDEDEDEEDEEEEDEEEGSPPPLSDEAFFESTVDLPSSQMSEAGKKEGGKDVRAQTQSDWNLISKESTATSVTVASSKDTSVVEAQKQKNELSAPTGATEKSEEASISNKKDQSVADGKSEVTKSEKKAQGSLMTSLEEQMDAGMMSSMLEEQRSSAIDDSLEDMLERLSGISEAESALASTESGDSKISEIVHIHDKEGDEVLKMLKVVRDSDIEADFFFYHMDCGALLDGTQREFSNIQLNMIEDGSRSGFPIESIRESKDSDTVSTATFSSIVTESDASSEFLYVSPEDVLQALAEFSTAYNARVEAKMKMEIGIKTLQAKQRDQPLEEEFLQHMLNKLKYPTRNELNGYWDNVYNIMNPKGKEVWENVQRAFEQYDNTLKERNAMLDEVDKIYAENMELSYLLRGQMMDRGDRCGKPYIPNFKDLDACRR